MELWVIRYSAPYINIQSLFRRGTTAEMFDNSIDTINVSLKVATLANKGQYERYEIREITKFTKLNDISFRMGFVSVGRAKCDIKSEQQLQVEDEYKGVQKGCLALWSDPYSTFTRRVN